MDDVLAMCHGLPSRSFASGDVVIGDGGVGSAMYILVSGQVEIRKGPVVVTRVSEPGSFLGEMAALLDRPHSADVVAVDPTEVLVVADASACITANPELTLAVARLLARRLHAVTTYLSDLKRQYADADGHLAMMDQVLSELISMRPGAIEPGSERGDMPDC